MFNGVLAIVALAAGAQSTDPTPEAWICQASKQLTATSIIELRQQVAPGGGTFALEVQLRAQSAEGDFQSFRWTLDNSAPQLREPSSAALALKMRRRLRAGNIVLSNSEQTIRTPITFENFTPAHQGQAWIVFHGLDLLRHLWAHPHWHVSVVDSRGKVRATTTVDLPPAQSMNEAASRLAPELQAKISDPASLCSELGPDSTI